MVEDSLGHTLGLATMEDLVAELVGEIEDQRATLGRSTAPDTATASGRRTFSSGDDQGSGAP